MNNENTLVGKLTKFCNSVYGAAIIGFLVIFTALINFIQFNQYPFFSMGILLNILVIVALSFCMALVYKFAPQSIKNFLIFLLGMFGLGLYSQSIWGYVLLLVLYIIVKNRLLGIYAVLSLVILVTSPVKYLFVQDAEIPFTEKRVGTQPFILHLVMDEHIGLKGLDSYIVDVKDAKTEIRDFYNKNGFNLYEGAYSKQSITVNSMPIILNFGDETFKNNGFMQEVSLGDNKYFNLLEEKGYEIKIFQSDFIDYCKHSSVIACETTLRSGPMPADIDQENLTIFEKTWVVGYPFVANSPLIRMLFFGLDNTVILLNEFGMDIDVVMAVGRGQLISPYGLSTFNQLNKAIEHAKPGQVYFTHAIFPHSPYIFDKNCKLKKYANWAGQLRPTGTREHREEANIDQNFCATLQVEKILDTLNQSAVKDNYIVIIHGDHGSRITEVIPEIERIEHASNDDIIKSFSTMFAVKYARPIKLNNENAYSVDNLLGTIANNNFLPIEIDQLKDEPPMIFINDAEWQPQLKRPLPIYNKSE